MAEGKKARVLSVDKELCIACGACYDNHSKYFKSDKKAGISIPKVKKVKGSDSKAIAEIEAAVSGCPSDAIEFK